MLRPIVSIIGKSGTGKTTLLEKIVRELTGRGYRVGTIKHDAHEFEIDYEGKDSWRHKHAGALITVISSRSKIAVVRDSDHDADIDELAGKYFDDVDIVLVEGYKRSNKPKIEVYRSEVCNNLLSGPEANLIAIATDSVHPVNVPQFNINDTQSITNFIEKEFLRGDNNQNYVYLEVNGRPVSVDPLLGDVFTNTIYGMISSLEGCQYDIGSITIKISKVKNQRTSTH